MTENKTASGILRTDMCCLARLSTEAVSVIIKKELFTESHKEDCV